VSRYLTAYLRLREEYNKLRDEYERLKRMYEDLVCMSRDEYERIVSVKVDEILISPKFRDVLRFELEKAIYEVIDRRVGFIVMSIADRVASALLEKRLVAEDVVNVVVELLEKKREEMRNVLEDIKIALKKAVEEAVAETLI
jgi:hypothetical protein